jgi:SAM-dependent methyltransferase
MKDNFSKQSDLYAQFRPQYPDALFEFLYQYVPRFESAWDCGTGNGQFAQRLAERFTQVYATDISAKQLEKAPEIVNVQYALEAAETCGAPDAAFDLIVVAQAAHWFNLDAFYREVRRVLRPDGVLVLLGYSLLRIDNEVNVILDRFYRDKIGPYWDAERKHVDAHYQSFTFPFYEIETPLFWMEFEWSFAHFIGYLNTWSAVQHYIKQNGENPVDDYLSEFSDVWAENEVKTIRFPIFLRLGTLT